MERIPDVSDRRGTLICLTDEGFKLINAAVTAHVKNEHRVLSVLDSSEREKLAELLRKLLVSLED